MPSATSPVYVDLPAGWQPRKPTVATVGQIADFPELKAHFTLAIQPQTEFNNNLMEWAEATKKATAEQTKLTNRTETSLKQGHIGVHSVVEYQIEGSVGTSRGISRVIMLPVGEWFCKVMCWTTPDNWLAAQPKFDELICRLRIASSSPSQ